MALVIRNERGSALILAIMAMLIMGVLSISFALLADIEARVGIGYKQQGQAEALAEAALEMARDAIRTAPVVGSFTPWLSGPNANHMLFSNVTLATGTYSARIDNDCSSAVPGYPAGISEGATQVPPQPCDNNTDKNQVAILTAWGVAGNGQSRVRAVVGVDNPWKHVCSDAKPDNNGYCNDPANRNGSPTVNPADPNDPNGPQAYNDLPLPVLGCSRIAPALHRRAVDSVNTQQTNCNPGPPAGAFSQMYSAPYPTGPGVPRFVIMGEDPAVNPNARTCNEEPNVPFPGNGHKYFGYFDCALSTFCDGTVNFCGTGAAPPMPSRRGCLHPTDTRVMAGNLNQTTYNPGFARYVAYDNFGLNKGTCHGPNPGDTMQPTDHGMVFWDSVLNPEPAIPQIPAPNGSITFGNQIGSMAQQFDVYMLNGTARLQNNTSFFGTFVVEGDETPGCNAKDFLVGGGATSAMWAGPNTNPAGPGWVLPAPPQKYWNYGYPLVAMIYNPDEPMPTIVPTYTPQDTCADMGSNNSQIHGMIYSGGHVEFNPLTMDGTVVAFEIQTQGSATYNYNTTYGDATPPPGFPFGAKNQVVVIRKSFMVCVNYHDDSGGATNCN